MITNDAIDRLAQPPWRPELAFNGPLIADLGVNQLAFILEGLARLRPDIRTDALFARLNALASRDAVDRLIVRLIRDLPLSQPPWPGTSLIRPILTVRELQRVGHLMRNCLAIPEMWSMAMRGDNAYYWCEAAQPVLVGLRRHRLFDAWHIDEIRGRAGTEAPNRQRQRIIQAFAKAGIADLSRGGPLTF